VQLSKLIGRRGLVAALVALALSLAILPTVAFAATTPQFPVGSRPVFRAHTTAAAAKHGVWITIASRRRVSSSGELKQTKPVGYFAQMHNAGHGNYTWKPPAYTFDTWFMNRVGTYWWQTYYIDCHFKNCHRLSAIHAFKVVPPPQDPVPDQG
jgi:hypothetical protein